MFPNRTNTLSFIDQRRILRNNHSLTGEPERPQRRFADNYYSPTARRSSVASQGSTESETLHNSRLIPTDNDNNGESSYQRPEPAASDAMCVSNALIGLVAASYQTFFDLEDINFAPRSNTACIARAISVIKSFKPTTQLLYKWLRRFEFRILERAERPSLIELDVLIVVLAEGILAVSELDNLLVDIVREAAAGISEIKDTVPAYALAILDACERIERVESVMSKLLTILQISGDAEAQRARRSIETTITQILQDNTSLADRMRNLEDIFGARALVSQERQTEAINRPPPGYSVPTPGNAEVLPDYTDTAPNGAANADGSITIHPIGWSIFAGLTLDDVRILSLIPVPLVSGELRYGEMYTFEYSRKVDLRLGNLMEQPIKQKVKAMVEILGLRQDNANDDMEATANFSRRVGMEYGNTELRDRTRRRPRPQPSTVVGGPQ